ncbi:hypothetical protein EDB92DRAFT_1873472 [Lactarius akahatsu]|uniref:DUF1746 domain-containing protein n=1 Tax=Lactarius akahatsu TaxID=416441 RepID=A0AAD4LEC3_9AGAM|nr:hypothetical protein EDB92DRAFT_1873472 [Lactarius akahatsu]
MLIRHNAMHIRYATQRQHIVDSLDALLYQLHALSFLLAPSIVTLFVRAAGQFQLSHPREFGPQRTLRFRFMLIFLFNAGSFWNHVIPNAPHSRSVVLDFVGMAFTPPRTQLLLLDLLIIVLSVVVTTVAPPSAATLDLTPATSAAAHTYADPLDRGDDDDSGVLVLDLRPSLLLRHMRSPPPPPPDDAPLPNGATVVEGLRVLLQAQRSFRARQQTPPADDAETQTGERVRERRVPGGMDPPEDGG